jgi:hypothetical protein
MADQKSKNLPFSPFVSRLAGTSGGGRARGKVTSGLILNALSNGRGRILEFQSSCAILFIERNVKSMETKTTWAGL